MNRQDHDKYSRQILFQGIGETGQEKLLAASAVLVGCGALGTVAANLLVRAGVGRLRIIDRDFVEPSNLQRQTLFEEADAREALPKAVAAERRLRAINSSVAVEGVVADATAKNARELLAGFPLVLDGTDNFETRLLLNDAAIAFNVPWIYAAAVGSYGVTMTIRPGETACLACLLEGEEKSAALGAEATCDTTGVLNAAVGVVPRSKRRRRSSCLRESQRRCTDGLFRAMSGAANSNLSAWREIRNAAHAASESFPILRENRSPTSRCAGGIQCRSTSAAVGSILARSAGSLLKLPRPKSARMNSCFASASRRTK